MGWAIIYLIIHAKKEHKQCEWSEECLFWGVFLSAQVTTERSGAALFQLDMTHSTLIVSLKGECSNLEINNRGTVATRTKRQWGTPGSLRLLLPLRPANEHSDIQGRTDTQKIDTEEVLCGQKAPKIWNKMPETPQNNFWWNTVFHFAEVKYSPPTLQLARKLQ